MKRRPEATGWVWLRGVVWGVLPWVAAVRMQGQVLVEEVRTFTVGTTLGDVQDPPATFGVTVGGLGGAGADGGEGGVEVGGSAAGVCVGDGGDADEGPCCDERVVEPGGRGGG